MEKKNIFSKIKLALKERVRKTLVALKRNPHFIPLAMLLIAFGILSFNLTRISNTTATMNKTGMGLCAFISMLLSILSMVCMLNAFPKRSKPNMFMVIVMLAFFAIIIGVDVTYYIKVSNGINAEVDPIKITTKNMFIIEAQQAMIAHIVAMALTSIAVVLEPVLAKLLKKINTSVDVEDNGEIATIDITEEG